MTDKQIIIDDQKKTIHRLQDECTEKTNAIVALGEQLKAKEQEYEELKKCIKYLQIDVTGCKYSTFSGGCTMLKTCNNNPDCYYKQLKRKEQECEELKKQVCGLRPELKYIIDKTCSKYNIEAKYYHEKIVEIINNLDKLSKTADEEIESLESEVRE